MLKIKKIKPLFTAIITTMNYYEEDTLNGNLIDTKKMKGSLKEYQKVLAVGSCVHDIKEGDLVQINPIRYAKRKHQKGSLNDGVIQDNPIVGYEFNILEIDGKQCLLLQDRDIDFIIEDYSEEEDKTQELIIPNKTIIM